MLPYVTGGPPPALVVRDGPMGHLTMRASLCRWAVALGIVGPLHLILGCISVQSAEMPRRTRWPPFLED
ncbi:hypothetical protein CKA34_18275 [Rhizobium sp. 11515TR]|nr:hypothetical protein CKA34_18275 [Rhizobium sp. 11515TR]